MSSEEKWHKPTGKEKLQEAHTYFKLPRITKRKKRLDWWDKVKISLYEEKADAQFEVIPPFMISDKNDDECDARDDDSSNEAG